MVSRAVTEPVAELHADLVVDTDKAEPEVEKGLRKLGNDVDGDMEDIGKQWGKTAGDALEGELEKSGPHLARTLGDAVDKEGVKISRVVYEVDKDNNITRRWVTTIARNIEQEVKQASSGGGGGIFGKIGQAIGDAIGAGFNISGKSPLILALVPVIGFIVELVLGLIQAISGAAALLATIPGLLFAIGTQAGVLFLAFHGLGEAITGAFAAKDAKELNEAIKNLTPSAQSFVKSLLPLRDLFNQLSATAQESFFKNFGNVVAQVATAFGPHFAASADDIAGALGRLFNRLLGFFTSNAFLSFFDKLAPSIVKWLDDAGPAFYDFFFGLTTLAEKVIPFMDWFGKTFNQIFEDFGFWLNTLSADKDFLSWLDDMKDTINSVGHVIEGVLVLGAAIASAVNQAGGQQLLEHIAGMLNTLAAAFTTDLGIKAIEGLIHAVEFLSVVLMSALIALGLLFALFELVLEFLKNGLWPWLQDLFTNMIPELFTKVKQVIEDFISKLLQGWNNAGAALSETFNAVRANIVAYVSNAFNNVVDFARSLPGRIGDAVGNLAGTLYQAGRNLIQGLINGALSMIGPLVGAWDWLMGQIKDRVPHSPAKEGPLSGKGDMLYAGQEIVSRLNAGMEMEMPKLESTADSIAGNFVFGAGAVQMDFYGAIPTQNEALRLGSAVGSGITSVLNQRDTRMAIRAIG